MLYNRGSQTLVCIMGLMGELILKCNCWASSLDFLIWEPGMGSDILISNKVPDADADAVRAGNHCFVKGSNPLST